MCHSSCWKVRAAWLVLLIFTLDPMAVRAVDTVSRPRDPASSAGNSELRFWVQIIEYLNSREVLILDVFGFLGKSRQLHE